MVSAKTFREKKGTMAEKLAATFVPTEPPTNMKKVTNLYYDPTTGELKFTAEA